MVNLFANSADLDQTSRSAAPDLGLHCLPIVLLRVSRLQWLKITKGTYAVTNGFDYNVTISNIQQWLRFLYLMEAVILSFNTLWMLLAFLCFVLFVLLLLCSIGPVWHCDRFVGEEGLVTLLVFLYLTHTKYGCREGGILFLSLFVIPRFRHSGILSFRLRLRTNW